MKNCALFVLILFLFVPVCAHANVTINEVAWMGTAESANGEWVELHNNGNESVDLAGWKLYEAGGGTLVFTLTKSIPAGDYLIIERTTPSVTDPLPGIDDESGSFGGSGFANTGESLVLKDSSGGIIDTLPFQSGWPAGDATTKETMQKSGSSWITARGTPKAANASEPTDTEDNDDEDTETEPTQTFGSGRFIKAEATIEKTKPDPAYKAALSAPIYAVRGVPTRFQSIVLKDGIKHVRDGRYEWSMGDGKAFSFDLNEDVIYTYEYPGTYTVVFRYYSNDLNELPDSIHTQEVTVLDATVLISRIGSNAIKIENKTGQELDIGRWRLIAPSGDFYQFPMYTYIGKNGSIITPDSVTKLSGGDELVLETPRGDTVATTVIPVPVTPGRKWYQLSGTTKTTSPEVVEASEVPTDSVTNVQDKEPARRNVPWSRILIGLAATAVAGYATYRYTNSNGQSESIAAEEDSDIDDYDLEELLEDDE
jgi:hypothetical protein